MADPMTMMMMAGTLVQAGGTIMQGQQAAAAGKAEQAQAEQRAKEEVAAGQRAAGEELRKKQLAQSNLVTQAGASGSGASDETVMKLWEGIEAEGDYNVKTTQATARNKSQDMQYQGALAKWRGNQARKGSYFDAAGTIMGTYLKTPMMKKYGGSKTGSTGYGR